MTIHWLLSLIIRCCVSTRLTIMSIPIRNVLISEKVDNACVKILEDAGIKVDVKPGLPAEELKKEIKNYNALVVRSATKVTAELIAAGASNLQVIGRAGTGVDNIDCNAATRNGILVINAPGGNTLSAAELTCGMVLSLARNIPQGSASLKSGKWDRANFMGQEVLNKTLAIIGLGRIGREVAARMQSFGMTTIGFDPLVPPEISHEFGVEGLSLEEIWPRADFITVHVPLIPQTKNLLNDATFAKCRKGVCVINCARGGIIEEEALLRALQSGQCGGAALDVFMTEPPQNTALIQHPKVVCTPHLGASTKEAQLRVAEEIAEQFVELVKGNSVLGVVNAPTLQAYLLPENQPLIGMCENLAKVATALLKPQSLIKACLTTKGDSLEKKSRLLSNAITVGLIKGQGKDVNFVSAPALSADAGIQIESKHENGISSSVNISASSQDGKTVTAIGCVQGNTPLLCSLDNACFVTPVPLKGKLVFNKIQHSKDALLQILTIVSNQGLEVNSCHWSQPIGDQQWCVLNLKEGGEGLGEKFFSVSL